MKLKIETIPEKYFHQLIEIFSVLPPVNVLRKRQREVFAEILYYNYKYSKESPVMSNRLLFDYKTKEEIAEKLKISKANLYNIYKELRQLGLLMKDEINPKYKYEYLQPAEIIFDFSEKTGV